MFWKLFGIMTIQRTMQDSIDDKMWFGGGGDENYSYFPYCTQ